MKTITDEVKAKIFSQYMPNKILINGKESNFMSINRSGRINKLEHDINVCSLILTSISDITDEDCSSVAKIFLNKVDHPFHEIIIEAVVENHFLYFTRMNGKFYSNYIQEFDKLSISQCQYLQSKGYAFPYLSYSVEDLVELGVYNLK